MANAAESVAVELVDGATVDTSRDSALPRTVIRAPTMTFEQTSWPDRGIAGTAVMRKDARLLAADSVPQLVRLPSPHLAQQPTVYSSRSMPQIRPPTNTGAEGSSATRTTPRGASPSGVHTGHTPPAAAPLASGGKLQPSDNIRITWPPTRATSSTPRGPAQPAQVLATTSEWVTLTPSGSVTSLQPSASSTAKPTSVKVPLTGGSAVAMPSTAIPVLEGKSFDAIQVLEGKFKDIVEQHVQELLTTLEASLEQHHAELSLRIEQIELRWNQQNARDTEQEQRREAESLETIRNSQCQVLELSSGLQQRVDELQGKLEAIELSVAKGLEGATQGLLQVCTSMEDSIAHVRADAERSTISACSELRLELHASITTQLRGTMPCEVRDVMEKTVSDLHSRMDNRFAEAAADATQKASELRAAILADARAEVCKVATEMRVDMERSTAELQRVMPPTTMREDASEIIASTVPDQSRLDECIDAVAGIEGTVSRHDACLGDLIRSISELRTNLSSELEESLSAKVRQSLTEDSLAVGTETQTQFHEELSRQCAELQVSMRTGIEEAKALIQAHDGKIAELSKAVTSLCRCQEEPSPPPVKAVTFAEFPLISPVAETPPAPRPWDSPLSVNVAMAAATSVASQMKQLPESPWLPKEPGSEAAWVLDTPNIRPKLDRDCQDTRESPALTFQRLLAELAQHSETALQDEASSRSSRRKSRTFSVQRGSLDFEIEDLFFDQDDTAFGHQDSTGLSVRTSRTSLVLSEDGGDEDMPDQPTNEASSRSSSYHVPAEQPVRTNGEFLDIRPL